MPAGEYLIDVYVMDSNMNAEAVERIVLVKAGAVVAGSIVCTVLDAADQSPILDGAVSREPGNQTITFNVDGIYVFTAVTDDQYEVTASAPGYLDATQTVEVSGGEIASLVFELEPDPDAGNGGGNEKPEGSFALCSASTSGGRSSLWSDLMLVAGLIFLLFVSGRNVRRYQ